MKRPFDDSITQEVSVQGEGILVLKMREKMYALNPRWIIQIRQSGTECYIYTPFDWIRAVLNSETSARWLVLTWEGVYECVDIETGSAPIAVDTW